MVETNNASATETPHKKRTRIDTSSSSCSQKFIMSGGKCNKQEAQASVEGNTTRRAEVNMKEKQSSKKAKLASAPALAAKVKKLRLEAIFYPKFENENQDDQQIRKDMIHRVSTGEGYLECTLKHSGSLLLWSGDQRFYSKNSTSNTFTAVGEVLLRQHFARAWDCTLDDCARSAEEKYTACSDFIETNRLSLSFEVVSSCLGHHGDIPHRDYLILISVADRNSGNFFSLSELIEFAQRFRLPHNDAWIFRSAKSSLELFELYDTSREIGMASGVIDSLNEASDGGIVKSMYPHCVFQGDILEGIVIRYVSYSEKDSNKNEFIERMKQLCTDSEEILKLVPPSKNVLKTNDHVIGIDLRDLSEDENFDDIVQKILSDYHGTAKKQISRLEDQCTHGEMPRKIEMNEVASELLSRADVDHETRQIAKCIQTLSDLKVAVSYRLVQETIGTIVRILCIVHVHHDASFQKYFIATKNSGGMKLYRGFSIELITDDEGSTHYDKDNNRTISDSTFFEEVHSTMTDTDSNENQNILMLKMKFLPYMVRTFICRNGLSILTKSGNAAFERYALGQLTRWKISQSSIDKWMTFFKGWALYCQSPGSITSDGKPLCKLESNSYLHHLNEFSTLFNKGLFRSLPSSDTPSFRGLVVLVGQNRESLSDLASFFAKELRCSKIARNVNEVRVDDMLNCIQKDGGGLVCVTEITDGVKNVRALAKQYESNIYIVMVGCAEEELEASLVEMKISNHGEVRKIKGMTRSWRKCKCNMLFELEIPRNKSELQNTDPNSASAAIIRKLKESSQSFQTDERAGLIVFFPVIPGSGKSSLCRDVTTGTLGIGNDRKLLLREGDRVKGKFYPSISIDILNTPACVAILDKNVPPISWSSIDNISTKSKSVVAAVFPNGLKDTVIGDSIASYVYPFSLQYLAVCMSRVLKRKPNTHTGKLDSATDNACMVVVKFYCFYRNVAVAELDRRLKLLGRATNKKLTVPFFNTDNVPELPKDLGQTLVDAVNLQTRDDLKLGGFTDDAEKQMEQKLRECIRAHQLLLDNLTTPLDVSRGQFYAQLKETVTSLGDTFSARCPELELGERGIVGKSQTESIKIVSLDIPMIDVHAALERLTEESQETKSYLSLRADDKMNREDDKDSNRFISSTHCTFAHASNMTQFEMHNAFSHLMGVSVEVNATALLFSDTVAAFEVEVPSVAANGPASPIPRPRNKFAHITVWCAKETQALMANGLPEAVDSNAATKILFTKPFALKGKFSFWYNQPSVPTSVK